MKEISAKHVSMAVWIVLGDKLDDTKLIDTSNLKGLTGSLGNLFGK